MEACSPTMFTPKVKIFRKKKLAKIQKCKIQMFRNFPIQKKCFPSKHKKLEMMIEISICPHR